MKRLILITTLTFLFISSQYAAVIYVDIDATGSTNGNDWANAYVDLSFALAVASSGDEIWVAEGVYAPDFIDRTNSFEIPAGVEVYGGFEGNESSRNQRNWGIHHTILSGEIGSIDDESDNSYTIVRIEEDGDEVVLDGFIIRDAYLDQSIANNAPVFVSADCRISHCQIIDNLGYFCSGLAIVGNTNVILDNDLFGGNYAEDGATIYQYPAVSNYSVSMNQCTVAGNGHAEESDDVIFQEDHWSISNSIFWDNETEDQFSFSLNSSSPMTHCVVQGITIPSLTVVSIFPEFNAPSITDYRIIQGSPVINQGNDALVILARDLAGNPRSVGQSDVGCYEYQGPRVIYVDPGNFVPNRDGLSWEKAFVEIENAFRAVVGGDQIWLHFGTHYVTPSSDRKAYLSLRNNVEVYGGFSGNEEAVEERDWRNLQTVISGNIGHPTQSEDNSYTIFKAENLSNVLIDGLTVQSANANGPGTDLSVGGAILGGTGSTLTVQNCRLAFNNAVSGGAAVDARGDLNLINCLVQDHQTETLVDGLVHCIKDLFVSGCFFTRNNVSQYLILGGTDNLLDITNCTFYDNESDGFAIGIGLFPTTAQVRNSVFRMNTCALDAAGDETQILFSNCIMDDLSLTEQQTGEGVYFEDPVFLDETNEDFRLCWASVGYDNGLDLGLDPEAVDYNGVSRVLGEGIDMGAFENEEARPIIYVDESSSGVQDGTSWETAYSDLHDALDESDCGTQIWVAQGIYKPHDSDRYVSFEMQPNTALYGGFAGDESNLMERDWTLHPTTLSGEIGNQNSTDDNSNRIVQMLNMESEGILDGFFIRGATELDADAILGAAIVTSTGRIRLKNLRIFENIGHGQSAIEIYGPDTRMENILIRDNHTFNGSTVSMAHNAYLEMNNCTVVNNTHTEDFAREISGTSTANAVISNCIVYGNENDQPIRSDLTVVNSLVEYGFSGGTNIINADPQFVNPLSNNFQLQQISPAVDAGENSYVKAEKDLIGNERIVGLAVDLGCFELSSACPADLNNDGVVNTADLTALLSEFGCLSDCGPDLNGDLVVNTGDLQIFLANYGTECSDD